MLHKVAIASLGCAKNQVDTEYLISLLHKSGYTYTGDYAAADAIIVNSCGFINPAKEESIAVTMELKEQYPGAKIVLAGCLAQRYGREMDLPEADALAGNRNLDSVIEALKALDSEDRPVVMLDGDTGEIERVRLLSDEGTAFVKIAEGCDNNCTYCAIPLIRGPVLSRPMDAVIEEIRGLVEQGVFEISLVAQDLASYGKDQGRQDLPELLQRISALSGDFWIRLLYIHPDRFPEEILPVMQKDPRILPYFDIPFQHASARVLRRMGRHGSAVSYLELIGRIRQALPDAVFRTTMLLGFPGEGESDRREVEQFLKNGKFLWAGFFIYSSEEGTPAYKFREFLPGLTAIRAIRWQKKLQETQTEISRTVLSGFVGRELTLLVEEPVQEEDLAIARSFLQAPEVDGSVVLHGEDLSAGQRIDARIVAVNGIDLEAKPVLR